MLDSTSSSLGQLNRRWFTGNPFTRPTGRAGVEEHVFYRQGFERLLERILFEILAKFLNSTRPLSYLGGKGGGRIKGAREIERALASGRYRFVYKTDVKSYYASIDLMVLFDKLAALGLPKWVVRGITNCVLSSHAELGLYRPGGMRGIAKGSSLSTLLGELYLRELDLKFIGRRKTYYQRYVDDIIILARSRKELREGIRVIKQALREHSLGTRYGKTFVGKTTEPILYLGYAIHYSPNRGVTRRGITYDSLRRRRKLRAERKQEMEKAVEATSRSGPYGQACVLCTRQGKSP